jgi:hypothetical protein
MILFSGMEDIISQLPVELNESGKNDNATQAAK